MSGVRLTLTSKLQSRLDMSPLLPETVLTKTSAEIGAMKLQYGRDKIRVDALFDIEPHDQEVMELRRASTRMQGVGFRMSRGELIVRGSVGDQTGAMMSGGNISIRGSTGLLCGAGMSEGNIEVFGDADDGLGGAFAGSSTGMAGGAIHVRGNAGARVGERMRRGLISIEGNVGPLCAASMIAGTIVVLGEYGPGIAERMRRGTLLVRHAPTKRSGIASNGQADLTILRIMLRELPRLQPRLKMLKSLTAVVEKFSADLALGGRGEILVLADQS